jgi:O-antigen/teichoic acid export membrane protein
MPHPTGGRPTPHYPHTAELSNDPRDDSLPTDQLHEAAAHGLRWSAIARTSIEIVQLGSIVILARLIVPAEFGRFAIAFIAQQVAFMIVAGGLSAALVQRKTISRSHLETGVALALIAGLALAILTLLVATVIVTPIFGARTGLFVQLMSPLCLVSAVNAVPMSSLGRRMAFRRISEIEMLNTFSRVAVCVALALIGLEGEALVLGLVAGSTIAAAMAWLSAPPPMPRLHRGAARDLLNYSLPTSMAAVSWVAFNNVDYAIVGSRLGALQTGFYYRAYTLAVEYQSKIAIVMTQVGFPVLSRTRTAADLTHLSRQMVRLLTTVLFPMLVLLAIAAPVVVPFLFGPRWEPAVTPVQILAIGGAATLVINAVGAVLMATGRARALLGYGVAHFLAYGVTAFFVVPLGINALAVDAAIVHTLFLVVAYSLMLSGSEEHALVRLWDDIAPATVSCLGLAAVAIPATLALTAVQAPAGLWLVALGLIALPAYLLTLRVCYPDTWRSQRAVVERVIPLHRLPVPGLKRRLAAEASSSV